jgi:membrane-bound ClpP family serine protease
VAVSSLGTSHSGTVYGSASVPVTRGEPGRYDRTRLSITASSVIAAFLAMLGAASILAGLTGAVGIEPLGLVRTAFYLGLGFAGAGAGGLLLIVLGDLRKTYDADSAASAASAQMY